MLLLGRPRVTYRKPSESASEEWRGAYCQASFRPMATESARDLIVWEERHNAVHDLLLRLSLRHSYDQSPRVRSGRGDLEEGVTRDKLSESASKRPDVRGIAILCPTANRLRSSVPTRANIVCQV
jgi:hypothetical protein